MLIVKHLPDNLLDRLVGRAGMVGAAAAMAGSLNPPEDARMVPLHLAYEPAIQRADQLDGTSGLHILAQEPTLFGIRRRSLLVGGLFTLAFIHMAYCLYRVYYPRQVKWYTASIQGLLYPHQIRWYTAL